MSTPEEEELMLRLKSQFGDLDLTNLLDANGAQNTSAGNESEESSLAEPSPEELLAWQEAQFQKGKAQVAAKRQASKTALQRRREELLGSAQTTQPEDGADHDDWEQLPSNPKLRDSSVFFPVTDKEGAEIVGVHPLLQQLAYTDEILGTTWQRLYSSAQGDGLSVPNLLQRVQGYPGPTVMLIGASPSASKSLTKTAANQNTNSTIGFFTTAPWNELQPGGHHPVSDSFFFAFDEKEELQTFLQKEDKKKDTLQHVINFHNSGSGGLWIGGTASQPRLHLTESLEECRTLGYDTQFEAGDLLLGHAQDTLNYFDATQIEVWAVGGEKWTEESLKLQQKHQAILEANRLRAQKVDKLQVWNDMKFQGGLLSTSYQNTGLFADQEYHTDVSTSCMHTRSG